MSGIAGLLQKAGPGFLDGAQRAMEQVFPWLQGGILPQSVHAWACGGPSCSPSPSIPLGHPDYHPTLGAMIPPLCPHPSMGRGGRLFPPAKDRAIQNIRGLSLPQSLPLSGSHLGLTGWQQQQQPCQVRDTKAGSKAGRRREAGHLREGEGGRGKGKPTPDAFLARWCSREVTNHSMIGPDALAR